MNNQNNTQDNNKSKTVKDFIEDGLIKHNAEFGDTYIDDHENAWLGVIEGAENYARHFQSRISELEKQNAVYREALEDITKEHVYHHDIYDKYNAVIEIAKQSLNHKDNG